MSQISLSLIPHFLHFFLLDPCNPLTSVCRLVRAEKGKGTRAQSASIDRSALKTSIKQSVDRLSQPRQPLKASHNAREPGTTFVQF